MNCDLCGVTWEEARATALARNLPFYMHIESEKIGELYFIKERLCGACSHRRAVCGRDYPMLIGRPRIAQ